MITTAPGKSCFQSTAPSVGETLVAPDEVSITSCVTPSIFVRCGEL
jgi:hypothetical protein